jgi:putative ATP-binding cassette transporter
MRLLGFFIRCSKNINYSRTVLVGAIVAGMVGGAANTAVLIVINSTLAARNRSSLRLVLAFVILCIVVGVSKFAAQALLVRFSTGTVAELRVSLSRQVVRSPLRKLEQVGPHRLLAVLTEDVASVASTLGDIPNLCINIVIVAGCLAYMAWLSWMLFLLVITTVFLAMFTYSLLVRRSIGYLERARSEVNLLIKNFRALVDGNKELQLHRERRLDFLERGIKQTAHRVANHRVASTTTYAVAEIWGETLIFVSIGLLLFAFSSFRDANTVTLTGFVIAFLYMVTPLQSILNTAPQIGQADVGIRSIEQLRSELVSSDSDLKSEPDTRALKWSKLELSGVVHTYFREKENTKFTLGPIHLAITPGSLIFVTGGNGSGKTTLVKVLTGLYLPEAGEVRLDGNQVNSSNIENYRQLFSVVFADFYLFDELHGLCNYQSRSKKYLSLLQLDNKVTISNGKFSTVDLSQGQRKRLALLIAYLEDRPIYVFDEWAADQDPLFREVFYHQLLPDLKARNKTVIIVSHDDRYYHVADRLIKLDYGLVQSDEILRSVALHTGTNSR